jgi:transposase-like protein
VSAKPKRRRTFTAEFKRRILEEAASCDRPGQLGALLRREGLYSSHLQQWRRERDAGALSGLEPKKRGPKVRATDAAADKLRELEREVARLKAENTKLQLICDVQKKVSQLLGVTLPTVPDDDDESSGRSS